MQLRSTVAFAGVLGLAALLSLVSLRLSGQQRPSTSPQFSSTHRAPRAVDGHPALNGI